MRILLLCKRRYTNRDLIDDRFGRLFHLPQQWARHCPVQVVCIDYQGRPMVRMESAPPAIVSFPASLKPWRSLKSFKALMQEAERFRPTVIVASSDILYGLLGKRLAHRLGASFVFDIYDDYRTFAANRYSGLALGFAAACRGADLVTCASRPLSEIAATYNPSTIVVGNGYDPLIFRKGRDPERRRALGVGEQDLLLIYPGSPIHHFDIELVVSGLERLNAAGCLTRLLLIGDQSNQVRDRSPYIIAHPAVGQLQVASLLRAADIGIAPYVDTPQTRVSAPCKLAEYLAVGLPVVSADVSDIHRYREHGILLHRPGSVDGFVAAIQGAQSRSVDVLPILEMSWESIANYSLSELQKRFG